MKAYVYQAALLCEGCGNQVCDSIVKSGNAPENTEDEHTFDSDSYPKGPYPDGGGEADCPQHCDHCSVFLENPLTCDGQNYVMNTARFDWSGEPRATWRKFYSYLFQD